MADWAQLGIGYDVARRSHGIFARAQYALSARWSYIKYRSTLFALSVGFYSFDLWKRVNRYVRGIKYAEDEFDDEWVQESKQKQMVNCPPTLSLLCPPPSLPLCSLYSIFFLVAYLFSLPPLLSLLLTGSVWHGN